MLSKRDEKKKWIKDVLTKNSFSVRGNYKPCKKRMHYILLYCTRKNGVFVIEQFLDDIKNMNYKILRVTKKNG